MSSPAATPRPGSAGRTDHGAAALEWVGAITVTSVLIGALASSVVFMGRGVQGGFESAVCRMLSLGLGDCAQPPVSATAASPAEACTAPPGSPAARLPVTQARLSGADGRVWEKSLTSGGAYRVSLRATSPGSTGPGSTDSGSTDSGSTGSGAANAVTVDAAEAPVTLERGPDGALTLPAGSTWLAPSSTAADALVSGAITTRAEDAVLGATPARTAWDGLRSLLGSGTEDAGLPDETVVAAGVVVDAADAATGLSSYASGTLGTTRPLGVRVSADGRSTVYLATAGSSGTDVVSALTVDSTGAPQNVGVSVLPAGLTSSALTDPAVMRAFGWDDAATGAQDGAAAGAPPGRPLALSARIALDGPGASAAGGAAGDRALSAASSLLSAVGVQQWSVSTGSGDPVTGFATAARADGELYARTSAGTVDEPATGLQPTPGGVPLAWDTVRKGPGDGAAFDGRAWTAGGPCG